MSYQGKRVLITGADGFIGSHLAEELVTAGARVTALSLYNAFDGNGWLDSLAEETRAALTIQRGDVRDAAFMLRLVERQEVVFHLAALIGIPYSYVAAQSYVDVNVSGTLNLLEAARRSPVERLIHTSTSEVYGTALTTPIDETHPLQGQSPYAASKIAADVMVEAYVRSFELPAVTLRPFNTYGPRQSERAVIPTIIRQAIDPHCRVICIGDVTPRRDFNYVADTVDAFIGLAAAPSVEHGTVYNSGTGQAVSIGEVVERILRITGSNKPVESEASRRRPDNSEVRLLLADHRRLSAATGWQPRVTLDEGLERTATWWRERLASGRVRADASYAT